MATVITESLVDDLDGSVSSVETITFGLDGKEFEIDLSGRNASALRKIFAPYVKNGRKTTRRKSTKTGRRSKKPVTPAVVRAWALDNGIEVSTRGRVARSVVDAYLAAA